MNRHDAENVARAREAHDVGIAGITNGGRGITNATGIAVLEPDDPARWRLAPPPIEEIAPEPLLPDVADQP